MCSFTASRHEKLAGKLPSFQPAISRCLSVVQPASPNIPFCVDLVQLLAAMVLETHQQGAMSSLTPTPKFSLDIESATRTFIYGSPLPGRYLSIRRAPSASMGSGNRHCGWAGQKNRSV